MRSRCFQKLWKRRKHPCCKKTIEGVLNITAEAPNKLETAAGELKLMKSEAGATTETKATTERGGREWHCHHIFSGGGGERNSKSGEKYETTKKVLTPAAPVIAEQSMTATTTAKCPPMAPRLENETSANCIGTRLLFHTNLCERNHHHNFRQRGGIDRAPMLLATPAAVATAAVAP